VTPTGVVVEGGGGDFSSSLRELPFVGRETPLAALVSAVQAAELGESVVALVAGEPGIGKTRLVREMAARVTCRVLWAVGWEGDGAPAYWPWLQLLRALRSLDHGDGDGPEPNVVYGVDVLMGNAPSSDVNSDARFEVFDAVAEVFALASQRQPLVLVFEDLHWADEASIRLLEFLSRDRRPRRLAMVGTYRDSELDRQHPLARRLAELVTGGLHLTLGGLGRRDVAALVVAMGEDGEGAARIVPLLHRKSGGNPFFLRELVRLLRVEGALDSSMPNVGSAVPAGVRAVVARRLDRLASSTLEVLEAAAVVGTDFDVSLLHAVTGRRTEELLAGLDEAMAAGIVIRAGAGGGFSFVHALVREALYEGLALGTRARLHQELAEVIQAHHGDERPTELAYHVLHSSVSGADERAVECCVRAAEWSLGLLAYEEAAAWYGRALDLLRVHHPGDLREGELLLRLGEAHVAAGDLPAARETYRQAAVIARRRGDAEQLTAAALGLGAGLGGFEVRLQDPMQIELLEEAQAALDPAPSRLRAWVLARLSVALSFVDAEARRLALSEEAVVMARQLGDVAVLGYALAGRCDAVAGPDHCETRLADASEVVRLARKAGDRQLELLGRRLRLVALLEVGDLDRADVEIERFGHVAEQVRQPLYRWYVPLWRGMRALMRGDLDEAARRCAEAEDIGAAAHSANAVVLTFLQWWVRQRYEGRFVEAGTAMAELLGREPSGLPVTAGLRTVAALQAGETDRAIGSLLEAGTLVVLSIVLSAR
jgi:tetratricopeptide (TPR) repeat protein